MSRIMAQVSSQACKAGWDTSGSIMDQAPITLQVKVTVNLSHWAAHGPCLFGKCCAFGELTLLPVSHCGIKHLARQTSKSDESGNDGS